MTLKNKLLASTPAVAAEGWDLRTAVLPENFYYGSITGLYFKPDGTKLYIGYLFYIYQYNLSTPWNVNTATYVGASTAFGSSTFFGLKFNNEGTVLYFTRQLGSLSEVRSFGLSTAWDITTAGDTVTGAGVYVVGSYESQPADIYIKPDGTKLYVMGYGGDDVNEFNLSTAWDVTTASYVQNYSISSKETSAYGLFFKSDGTKMYVCGNNSDSIHEYGLSTAWDVSTASFTQSFSLAFGYPATRHIYFKPDGAKVYFYCSSTASLTPAYLSTAWDISTASVDNKVYYIGSQEINPTAMFFKPDGTKMYVMGQSGDDVNEYNLSVPWDITTASYVQIFGVGSQESTPTGLAFKPDGTKMYVMGSSGDDINEYNLSTAWNVSTASYVRTSIILPDSGPQALFFKPDGTKMYFVGAGADRVYEYDLLVPWNISTLASVQNFIVAAREINPTGLFFKPDGTRMYVLGFTNDNIDQYNLSVAWDISTAVYDTSIYIVRLEQTAQDIFFKPDGKKIYLIGSTSDRISTIDL